MNIFITHNTGCSNKGVEKMMKVVYDALVSKHGSDINVIAVTNYISYDEKVFPNIKFIYRANFPERAKLLYPFIASPIFGFIFKLIGKTPLYNQLTDVISASKWADKIVSIGGDMFSDDYNNLYSELYYLKLAKKYNTPIYLLGHTIGKFKSDHSLNLSKEYLRIPERIVIRDKTSFDYLRESGHSMENIVLGADLAFLFDQYKTYKLDETWSSLAKIEKKIGFNISKGFAKYEKIDYEKYISRLVFLINKFLEQHPDYTVILVPHVFDGGNDDAEACSDIKKLVMSSRLVNLEDLDKNLDVKPAECFKKLISTFDLFVSIRMHSSIASLSSSVPTLLFYYSIKAEGLMRLFFGNNFSKKLIFWKNSNQEILNLITYEIENKDETKKYLINKNMEVKKMSSLNFKNTI